MKPKTLHQASSSSWEQDSRGENTERTSFQSRMEETDAQNVTQTSSSPNHSSSHWRDISMEEETQWSIPLPVNRKPPLLQPGDTRFTEYRKKKRVYFCDGCGKSCRFEKQAENFLGSFVVFRGLRNHGMRHFDEMQREWENGLDFTWLCSDCHAMQGTVEAYNDYQAKSLSQRQKRTRPSNW